MRTQLKEVETIYVIYRPCPACRDKDSVTCYETEQHVKNGKVISLICGECGEDWK